MRLIALSAALYLLTGCGPKTCEQQGFVEIIDGHFEVTLPEQTITIHFDPSDAGELFIESEDGDVIWHILCDADADGFTPNCLESPIPINGDTPEGASRPTETGTFEDGVGYHAVVRDYDNQCEGQVRSGQSTDFILAR